MSNGMMKRGIWRQEQRTAYKRVKANRDMRKGIMKVSGAVEYKIGDFVSTSCKPHTFYEIVSANVTGTEFGILVKGKLEFVLRGDIYKKRDEEDTK